MSRHVIIPPKGDRTPAQPASEAEAKAVGISTAPAPNGTAIADESIERIAVPKGTSVLIGGRSYIAQSDAGVTVRKFKHNDGGPTSVTIIDAPTKEAAAFAAHLVGTGQMFSEDEIRAMRARGLLKQGESPNPRVHRERLSQATREAMWLDHQAKMQAKIDRLEAQLRAAGLEPEAQTTTTTTTQDDAETETVKIGAK